MTKNNWLSQLSDTVYLFIFYSFIHQFIYWTLTISQILKWREDRKIYGYYSYTQIAHNVMGQHTYIYKNHTMMGVLIQCDRNII